MGIQFDESDDYFVITDAAELTLQDGDWCVGIWTYVSDNAGNYYQYLFGNNAPGDNNNINLLLCEASEGTYNDKWNFIVKDGDGTTVNEVSSSSPGADSKWRLIVVQRDTGSNEVQMWFCEAGQSASKEASGADTDLGAINGGDWNLGRRTDGDANRYYGSIACEFWKGDFALTQAEIEALAAGLPIKTFAKGAGETLDVYLPMWISEATLLDYSGNGNSGARQSSPTTAAHAPVCTPTKRRRM